MAKTNEVERTNALSDVGTAFHAYRAAYATHLSRGTEWSDRSWVDTWLRDNHVTPDARGLIEKNAAVWKVNPNHIYGSELFFSIDADFKALEIEADREPGSLSSHPNAFASGQVDLLLIDGEEATIVDAKSGFSTQAITEEEAAIYCCLIFAHFPQVTRAVFWWDYVRIGQHKRSEYSRDEFNEIRYLIEQLVARRAAVEAKSEDELTYNREGGMCPYCRLACPGLKSVRAGKVAVMPLQSEKEAAAAATLLYLCEQYVTQARSALKDFLIAREDLGGQLPLGPYDFLQLTSSQKQEFPVIETLQTLGMELVSSKILEQEVIDNIRSSRPVGSPNYDIPLHSLRISTSSIKPFLNTKTMRSRAHISREGLKEQLKELSAPRGSGARLTFRRSTEDPALEAFTGHAETEE